jgi:hypothetical protein
MMEKVQPLQLMLPGKGAFCLQKTETRSMSITLYYSKCVKDLNTRLETPKLVQERAGNTLEAIAIGKDFLN